MVYLSDFYSFQEKRGKRLMCDSTLLDVPKPEAF